MASLKNRATVAPIMGLIMALVWSLSSPIHAEDTSDDMAQAILESAEADYRIGRYFDALNTVKPAAEAGYAPAQHFYAYLNWGGSFYDEAYIWYEKAALQGHKDSIYALVSLIQENEVSDKTTAVAVEWLKPLAAENDPKALELLFLIDSKGRSDWPANANSALVWLTQALNAAQPWAMYQWSEILEIGSYNQQVNVQQALYWLTQAGEALYAKAIEKLISVYSTPLLQQKVDKDQIRYWSSKKNH